MAQLLKGLFAGLLLLALLATPAYADDLERANGLMAQENALGSETLELEAEFETLVDKILAIDAAGENAADALPMLAEAQELIARLSANAESAASLMDQITSLDDLSEEMVAYAAHMREVDETYVEYYRVTSDLLTRYQTVYDSEKLSQMSRPEIRLLRREFTELAERSNDLYAQLANQKQVAQQYYAEHDLSRNTAGGRSWISWIVGLTIASASALICGLVARKKNRTIIGWGVFGFFIPFPALIAIFVVRKIELEPKSAPLLQSQL